MSLHTFLKKPIAYFIAGLAASVVVYGLGKKLNLAPMTQNQWVDPNVEVRIVLGPNWKINESAPSRFTLSKRVLNENSLTSVQELGLDQLKMLKFKLLGLEPGGSYQLKGTVFICRTANTSVCAFENREVLFQVADSGRKGQEQLDLDLKRD